MAFSERGYHAVSIQDVAKLAKIPKTNIYYYFPSKSHILYALLEQKIDDSILRLKDIAKIEDAREQIRAIFRMIVEAAADSDEVSTTFMTARPDIEGDLPDIVTRKQEQIITLMTEATRRAMAAGVLHQADPEIVAIGIFNMPFTIYRWGRSVKASKEDVVAHLCAILGIANVGAE